MSGPTSLTKDTLSTVLEYSTKEQVVVGFRNMIEQLRVMQADRDRLQFIIDEAASCLRGHMPVRALYELEHAREMISDGQSQPAIESRSHS